MKASRSIAGLPTSVRRALEKLGSDISIARQERLRLEQLAKNRESNPVTVPEEGVHAA